MFEEHFQELFDTLDVESVSQKTNPVASGHPYKIWEEPGLSGFKYEVFSRQSIAEMLQVSGALMKPWGHRHIFWFNIQFVHWTDDIENCAKASLGSIDGSPRVRNGEASVRLQEKKDCLCSWSNHCSSTFAEALTSRQYDWVRQPFLAIET